MTRTHVFLIYIVNEWQAGLSQLHCLEEYVTPVPNLSLLLATIATFTHSLHVYRVTLYVLVHVRHSALRTSICYMNLLLVFAS